MNDKKSKIEILRGKIDECDIKLIKLIERRTNYSRELICEKIQNSMPVYAPERESDILRRVIDILPEDYSHKDVEKIFKSLFSLSKRKFIQKTESLEEVLNAKPIIIAGPCAVESRESMDTIVPELKRLGVRLLRGGTYKPRTNPESFQGLESDGVQILNEYTNKYDMFSVTEMLETEQIAKHINEIDILQIGSRSMTSYGLLKYAGKVTAESQKPIILKRGLSSTLNEFIDASKYITNQGNENILFCLRGIRTYEQIDSKMRNTPDLASILELKEKTDKPVIFDPSHASGDASFVCELSLAALELGADGLMVEVHSNPEKALSDAKQSITISMFERIMRHI